jgi:hypothetical protein
MGASIGVGALLLALAHDIAAAVNRLSVEMW